MCVCVCVVVDSYPVDLSRLNPKPPKVIPKTLFEKKNNPSVSIYSNTFSSWTIVVGAKPIIVTQPHVHASGPIFESNLQLSKTRLDTCKWNRALILHVADGK